eukprot:4523288-Prorocentrum_lima.AAC.1
MTSSLVGSEMCIRDRPSFPYQQGLQGWHKYQPFTLRTHLSPSAESSLPVSYTHLTLPTICSV